MCRRLLRHPPRKFIKLAPIGTFCSGCQPGRPAHRMPSVLCTPVDTVTVDGITVVGERINPTGKKRLQQALRDATWTTS